MMSPKQRQSVYVALVALFLISVVMAADLGRKHDEYLPPPSESVIAQTPFQALVPALLGIREIMASLMWIRTDDYFHRGEYRPIIRMVKLITTIDPHQIDVYATGAWHMAYNFMDKRLIREGLEFLEDGVRNNPTIYDLPFESGYTHMDKTKNYPRAIEWYSQAITLQTTDKTPAPAYVGNQLAHAYERAGLIDQAIAQWKQNLERAKEELEKKPNDWTSFTNVGVAQKNLSINEWRLNDRRDLAADPVNLQLEYKITKVAPRKLLIEGTINALDYARVHVIFRDRNWRELEEKDFETRITNSTLEWDNAQVRGGKFRWMLDLNADPADMGRPPADIYPLKAEEYELVVQFNPRTQPVFIQDRYGWNGEALAGPYVKQDPSRTGVVGGRRVPLRYAEKTTILKRQDVV
jgi:tetratricopeptide (TPR) repeat protein